MSSSDEGTRSSLEKILGPKSPVKTRGSRVGAINRIYKSRKIVPWGENTLRGEGNEGCCVTTNGRGA